MHRVFEVTEILGMVFGHYLPCIDDWSFVQDTIRSAETVHDCKSLYAAALTCRLFSRPALQALWWYMTDLLPVFSLFCNCQNGTLIGPILDEDLERFKMYTQNVRFYYQESSESVPINTIIAVLRACDRMSLFPHLQGVSVATESPELLFLSSTKLRYFVIQRKRKPPQPWTLMQEFLRTSPNLEVFSTNQELSEASQKALWTLPQLRILWIGPFSNATPPAEYPLQKFALCGLASFLHLAYLRLDWHRNLINNSPPPEPLEFPSLLQLDLTILMTELENTREFICAVTLPRLKSCTLDFATHSNIPSSEPADWKKFWKTVSPALPTKCSLSIFFSRPSASGSHFRLSLTLSQLVACLPDKLDRVDLPPSLLKTITLEDIEMVCRALSMSTTRCVQYLRLRRQGKILPGFDALTHIATKVALLDTLTIAIDLQNVPSTNEALDSLPILDHRLQKLTIECLSLPNPRALARSVDRLFPHLKTFEFIQGCDEAAIKTTQTLLSDLQWARKEQKARLLNDVASDPESGSESDGSGASDAEPDVSAPPA